MSVRCLLVLGSGPSRRVGSGGLLIGRQADCDVVGNHPELSRRHALIRLTPTGADVVPLSRGAIEVNGVPTHQQHRLVDGDTLSVPGLVLRVELEQVAESPSGLLLTREGGGEFGLSEAPFRIGGGRHDDLQIAGWPPSAIVITVDDRGLAVAANVDATVDDGELPVGSRQSLAIGARIAWGGEQFSVISRGDPAATTAAAGTHDLPHAVTVELLPRGGLAVFELAGARHTVYLADKRFDLVMALLQPPGNHQPGDFVDDDSLRAVVWPRNDGVGRTEINVLISRCRRDLIDGGLNGPRLIQRAPGGGGTRLALARGATIAIKR